jgi:arginine exporter protein ArgO
MTQEQTRLAGRTLMGAAVTSVLLVLAGMARRSYLVLAVPVFAAVATAAGLAFWVGYTMATTDYDDPADYGVEGPSRTS